MTVKIDKKLNLVVPIYGDPVAKKDDKGAPVVEAGVPVMYQPVTAYVHSTPIGRETFEKYFLTIAQTFSAIYAQGLGELAGPNVAMLLLERCARNGNEWEDDPRRGLIGVKNGLVEEIRRLTNVLVPGGNGWEQVPLAVAVANGVIDADDVVEVESAIVFFIVASSMHRRMERRAILESAVGLWGAQISSLGLTEFAASLGTSIATASSGAKPSAPAGAAPGATAEVDGKPASVAV